MTPIHRIAKTMCEETTLRKLTCTGYAGWKENQEKARKRAEQIRRK